MSGSTPFSIAPGRRFGGLFGGMPTDTGAQPADPGAHPASRPLSAHTAREDNTPPPSLRERSVRATSTRGTRIRHGSLEQNTDVFGRATERPTTPRRERSKDGERQSRERDRPDWHVHRPQLLQLRVISLLALDHAC